MTRGDALDVLALIMRCWPKAQEWDDGVCQLWLDDLARHERRRSEAAVHLCRQHLTFPPSWAEYVEAYRSGAVAAALPAAQPKAVTAGYLPKTESIRRLRDLRKILRADPDRALRHDHHRGPSGCPICGLHDRDPLGVHLRDCRRCKDTGRSIHALLADHTPEESPGR